MYHASDLELVRAEVYALTSMYFPIEVVDNMVAICQLESGFHTGAWNQDGEDSRGLYQINVSGTAHPDLARYNLFDARVNCYFAARIYRQQGYRAWYNSARKLGLI